MTKKTEHEEESSRAYLVICSTISSESNSFGDLTLFVREGDAI